MLKKLIVFLVFLCAALSAHAAPVQFFGGETGTFDDEIRNAGGIYSLVTSPVKSGTYAYRTNPSSGSTGVFVIACLATSGDIATCNFSDAYLEFDWRPDVLPTATQVSTEVVGGQNTSFDPKFKLYVNHSGNLYLTDQAGTTLATSATAVTAGTWTHISLKVLTGTSAAYQLKINNVSQFTGTANFTTANHGTFRFGPDTNLTDGSVDYYYDNGVIDSSAFQTSPLFVHRKAPLADGSTAQWTSGPPPSDYSTVNEVPSNSSNYEMSPTVAGRVTLVTLVDSATSGISGTIPAVKTWTTRRVNSTSTNSDRIRTREGGVNADTAPVDLTINRLAAFQLLTSKPSTGAWSTAALDSTEIGCIENNAVSVRLEALSLLVLSDDSGVVSTPTPTFTPSSTPTRTPTPVGTNTPTPTPTITPTPTATPTVAATVPYKQEWKDQWIEWSAREYDYMLSQNGWSTFADASAQNQYGAHYYDATRNQLVMPSIVGDTSTIATRIPIMRRAYRDSYVIPNNGGANGYTVFTGGLRKDWEVNGNSTSQNAVYLLSRNAAFNNASTPINWTENPNGDPGTNDDAGGGARENAYRVMAELDARALGYAPRSVLDSWVDQSLRHLDRWTVQQNTTYVRPFMVAIVAKALEQVYNEYPDYPQRSAIPGAIKLAYDYIWDHCWIPYNAGNALSRSFQYTDRATGDSADLLGTPDLNGLILPPFGFIYRTLGGSQYRTRGDEVLHGLLAVYDGGGFWVRGPDFGPKSTSQSGKKQFNQTYQWSYRYFEDAEVLPPTPTPTPMVTATPTPTATPLPGTPTVTPTPIPTGTIVPTPDTGKYFDPNSPFEPCHPSCCQKGTCPTFCQAQCRSYLGNFFANVFGY